MYLYTNTYIFRSICTRMWGMYVCGGVCVASLSVLLNFQCNCSNRRVVISHCGFRLHFPNALCWASFHVLILYLYIFFGEVSVTIFCHLKKIGASYDFVLRILYIFMSTFSNKYFAKILNHRAYLFRFLSKSIRFTFSRNLVY